MELKQINPIDAKKYKQLGEAFGINFEHCVSEGMLHCENFKERARYYVIRLALNSENEETKFLTNTNNMVIVEFYEGENV